MNALASLQRALQSHIVDGDMALAAAIDSEHISAATRLKIYSDAYRLRLIEALQANYPSLEKLLGAEQFARLTQLYLAIYPSRHYSIRWFGHELAEFLCAFEDYRNRPWLAELAKWEWSIATAFDATDVDALRVEDLQSIAPEQWPALRFEFHPAVQRLTLATNAAAIAKAAGQDEPLPTPQLHAPVDWLIWRKDLTVNFRSLDQIETIALDTLKRGADFGELCDSLSEYIDAEAVPPRAAAYLRQWIDEQLLAAKFP